MPKGGANSAAATPPTSTALASASVVRRNSLGTIRGRIPPTEKPARIEEQRQLQHLNTRLESYVSHHKSLRDERDRLNLKLEETISYYESRLTTISTEHQQQIDEWIERHDQVAAQSRANLDDAQKFQAELESLRAETHDYKQIKRERNMYRERARASEEDVARLQGKLSGLEELVDKLRRELNDANGKIEDLERNLELVAKDRDAAVEELEDVKSQRAKALSELRAHAKEQLQVARMDWERNLEEKLGQLENDLRAQYEDEIAQLHDREDDLAETVTQLREKLAAANEETNRQASYASDLLSRLKEAEDELTKAEASWTAEKTSLEELLLKEQDARRAKEDEFNDLMDVKISLDAEIAQYRRILEAEEDYYGLAADGAARMIGQQSIVETDLTTDKGTTSRSRSTKRRRTTTSVEYSSSTTSKSTRKKEHKSSGNADAHTSEQSGTADADTGVGASENGDNADAAEEKIEIPQTPSRKTGTPRRRSDRRPRTHEPHVPNTRSRASSISEDGEMRGEFDKPYGLVEGDLAPDSIRQHMNMMVDLIADNVAVENHLSESISLDGWTLRSDVGDQSFRFPDGFTLAPGNSVTVWSGPNAEAKSAPPEHLFWTSRFIWNNKGDTAVLYDEEGREVSRVIGEPATPRKTPRKTRRTKNAPSEAGSLRDQQNGDCRIM